MNPVHTLPIYLCKIHSNIILPSTPRSSEWSLPFGFFRPKFCVNVIWSMRVTCTAHHPSWLDHLNNFGGKWKLWSFWFHLSPLILQSTFFHRSIFWERNGELQNGIQPFVPPPQIEYKSNTDTKSNRQAKLIAYITGRSPREFQIIKWPYTKPTSFPCFVNKGSE
jgi:hypothetical protein